VGGYFRSFLQTFGADDTQQQKQNYADQKKHPFKDSESLCVVSHFKYLLLRQKTTTAGAMYVPGIPSGICGKLETTCAKARNDCEGFRFFELAWL
jgi:hypothetical protein